MLKRRVVVTGMGIVSPVGSTVESAWAHILAGRSGIRPITAFDVGGFPVQIGGPVKDFQVENYLNMKEAKKMDAFIHYGMAAAMSAPAQVLGQRLQRLQRIQKSRNQKSDRPVSYTHLTLPTSDLV